MNHGLLSDRVRVIKASEKKLAEAENNSSSTADYVTMRREEMRRRFARLRRAYLAVEQLLIEQGFDLTQE